MLYGEDYADFTEVEKIRDELFNLCETIKQKNNAINCLESAITNLISEIEQFDFIWSDIDDCKELLNKTKSSLETLLLFNTELKELTN